MHFSTLVTAKVTAISDEARAEAASARAYIEAHTNDDPKNIMAGINYRYAAAVVDPFAAEINNAVYAALAPYAQEADEQYLEFEDETEWLKHGFETGFESGILYNGKYYGKFDIPNFEVCSDGVVREKTGDGKYFLSPKAQKMKYVEHVPCKEFYGTFRKFADVCSTYCKEQKAWGYFYNPNCFYDWASIGGRWRGSLLVKEDVEECMRGVPGAGDYSDYPSAPEGYKWVDAARLKDIELEEMARQTEADIRNKYDKYKAFWDDPQATAEEDPVLVHAKRCEDGLYYFGCKVYDPTSDVETLVKEANCVADNALSRIFHAYLDSEAELPEESGYVDQDCIEGDWTEQLNDFVADLDPDTIIAVVDCHS
jgi:hypothetical protein